VHHITIVGIVVFKAYAYLLPILPSQWILKRYSYSIQEVLIMNKLRVYEDLAAINALYENGMIDLEEANYMRTFVKSQAEG
jgi:hypothetical protein